MMAEKWLPTAEYVRAMLDYEPNTGMFTWRVRADCPASWNVRYAGKQAGTLNYRGYWVIITRRCAFRAHRLAWLMTHGMWPVAEIDHINRNKSDNRLANLRAATASENQHNRGIQANNKSGSKGVSWHKHGRKWQVRIQLNGTQRHLGLFSTYEEARAAYAEAADSLHGAFARVE